MRIRHDAGRRPRLVASPGMLEADHASFTELTNEFLDAEFAESPVRASGLGLTEYDEQLDDLSERAFERRRSADAAWLERFRAT